MEPIKNPIIEEKIQETNKIISSLKTDDVSNVKPTNSSSIAPVHHVTFAKEISSIAATPPPKAPILPSSPPMQFTESFNDFEDEDLA